MQSRHRVASCNSQSKLKYHYLHMVTNTSNYRMKANSLPSILDSENGDTDITDEKENANKSPISVASYGKKKIRNKPWKYLQRQRTTEEMTPLEMEEAKAIIAEQSKTESQSYEDRNGFRQVKIASIKVFILIFNCIISFIYKLYFFAEYISK